MDKSKSIWLKILFLVIVFFLAVGVWYSPIVFKGYSTQPVSEDILLARNYHQTGVLAIQNDQNVTISSNLIKTEGHSLVKSQYLRSFFYAKIFDIFGVPTYNNLILISIILYAFVLVIFTILILYLFNFKTAVVFSLIYILIPFNWAGNQYLGAYEFCLLFLALFFVFYFVAVKMGYQGERKYEIPLYAISGVFLALSGLSKEATFVFALALFVFLIIKKLKKQFIYIFAPFFVLLLIFWMPSIFNGQNRYLPLLGATTEESIFSHYLHLFPDPYTYYFGKDDFLDMFRNQDIGLTENIETSRMLKHYGLGKVTMIGRLNMGTYLLSQHLFRFFSLEEFGGPFVTLLLILGFVYLRKKFKYIYELSKYWLAISFVVFSYILLVSRSHLIDFIWILVLAISFGIIYLIEIVENYFKLRGKKLIFFEVAVICLALYHLVLVNHVALGKQYDKDFVPRSIAYSQEINKFDIKDEEVIAVPGTFPGQEATLNYLTNKSFVIFRDSTLEKLLDDGEIKQAFEAFGVKYILGYSDELSARIVEQSEATNITSSLIEVNINEVSANKSFLMNLIR